MFFIAQWPFIYLKIKWNLISQFITPLKALYFNSVAILCMEVCYCKSALIIVIAIITHCACFIDITQQNPHKQEQIT